MASEFFGRQRECRFYTAGCGNKMAISVTGSRAVNESQSYRVHRAVDLVSDTILYVYEMIINNKIIIRIAGKNSSYIRDIHM